MDLHARIMLGRELIELNEKVFNVKKKIKEVDKKELYDARRLERLNKFSIKVEEQVKKRVLELQRKKEKNDKRTKNRKTNKAK